MFELVHLSYTTYWNKNNYIAILFTKLPINLNKLCKKKIIFKNIIYVYKKYIFIIII